MCASAASTWPKSSKISSSQPLFVFFGGKGGVGKTTCAAARAIADGRSGAAVLVVSTDPAHSLGDALGVTLSGQRKQVRVSPRASIDAVELDASRAFARWLGAHGPALADILEHGTWLDRADVDGLLDLSMPGIDELVGMLEIVRLAHCPPTSIRRRPAPRAYETVIIDTAPTGHMLRLLSAPAAVGVVADLLDALQEDHRIIRRQFGRARGPEAADRLIELVARQAAETGALLRDRAHTRFEWVMLPERLSLAESEDGLGALRRARVALGAVIVNRVMPDGPACPLCDRRRVEERRVIAGIPRALGTRSVRVVPAQLSEPRGVAALTKVARAMAHGPQPAVRRQADRGRPQAAKVVPAGRRATPLHSIEAFRGARLLFFGGKGGAGKTTAAAATALALARSDSSRRVLLLSTDPAHSLADVFGHAIGDRATMVPGAPTNLRVRELDAAAALAARRGGLEAALSEIAATFGAAAIDRTIGRSPSEQDAERPLPATSSAASRLLEIAPPGIDELFGMLGVVEAQREYPLIIVDAAPTGHALRLLEMPDAARAWVQLLMRVLLKYRSLVKPGQLAKELIELSSSIRALQALLRDGEATRFIVVTRAAELPRRESERLQDRLRRLGIAAPSVIVNALTLAPGACPQCRATRRAELQQIERLDRRCRRARRQCAIIQTPLTAPPPRGPAALERWAAQWIA